MILAFKVDNVVDIITNSSSELFIFKMDNGVILQSLLKSIDKDFFKDIGKPSLLRDSKNSLFETYIWSILPDNISYEDIENGNVPNLPVGMKIGDLYTFDEERFEWYLTENLIKYRDKFQEFLDPKDSIWLLYIDDYLMTDEIRRQVKQFSTHERM